MKDINWRLFFNKNNTVNKIFDLRRFLNIFINKQHLEQTT